MLRICTVILLLASTTATAEQASIPGLQGLDKTYYHRVESEALGKGYHILVSVPKDYEESAGQRYPTIYILDGGLLYPMLRGYYNYLRDGGDSPAAIIVGISYGTSDFQDGNDRSHDYTAPSAEREYYGGAAAFQAFLADELLPFIEDRYRSDAGRRVIFGQSIGGQFVIYTAQTEPSLFWGHIASNPALQRNLPFFLESHSDEVGVGRLFIGDASNDDEQFRIPRQQWIAHWSEQTNTPWDLHVETLDGHNHFSAPPASFRRGLIWLFSATIARPTGD